MMQGNLSFNSRTTLDIISVVAGLALLLSPWLFGFTAETAAAWNAWLVGAAIAIVALGALVAFHQAEEWANLVLGLWAIIAPWALKFAAVMPAVWVHVIAGVIVAVLAASRLWLSGSGRVSTG